MTHPILVTGATGRHGGTGRTVAKLLREADIPVRALARQADQRTAELEALGAEVVIGDLSDRRTLAGAFEGIRQAYFTYPVDAGIVPAAANFAAAGRAGGLERVVAMSMAATNPESPSPLGRAQWLAEQILEWAGFECLQLRIAALFVENLKLLHGDEIADDGVIRNSFGDVPLSWMTGEDAGRLAVAALLNPERFGPERAVYPSGGPQHTHAEVAAALSLRLGRHIRHETIPWIDWERRLASRAGQGLLNPDMATHISTVGAALRRTLPLNDLFETATGRKPASILETIADGRAGF